MKNINENWKCCLGEKKKKLSVITEKNENKTK